MPTPGDLPLQQHVTAFDPIEIGHLRLPNRIVMAPMTRSRAAGAGLATTLMARYYAQRASAGLIITEGIQPCVGGQGYPNTPGLHTVEQMRSWRAVTPAVHAAGDRIYDLLTPRALTASEVVATVHQFAQAARNAIIAGFDGVEVHGANGYLVHQFLSASTNLRTDEWSGTIDNRIRFAVEVVDAICSAIGAARTALRISPANPFNDMRELDAHATYLALVDKLRPMRLAYLHVVEEDGTPESGPRFEIGGLRNLWNGSYIVNGNYDYNRAVKVIADGRADFVSFGKLFLANPDLPLRFARSAPLNVPDRVSFYGGDDRGYIDYPFLEEPLPALRRVVLEAGGRAEHLASNADCSTSSSCC